MRRFTIIIPHKSQKVNQYIRKIPSLIHGKVLFSFRKVFVTNSQNRNNSEFRIPNLKKFPQFQGNPPLKQAYMDSAPTKFAKIAEQK